MVNLGGREAATRKPELCGRAAQTISTSRIYTEMWLGESLSIHLVRRWLHYKFLNRLKLL